MAWSFKQLLPALFSRKTFTYSRNAMLFYLRGAQWSNHVDYETLVKEGFLNSVASACLTEIGTAAAGVRWTLHQHSRKAGGSLQPIPDDHAAWQILRQANPWQSGRQYRQAMTEYYYLAGNIFISRVSVTRNGRGGSQEIPKELYLLIPDKQRFTPVRDAQRQLIGYIYEERTSQGAPIKRNYALPTFPQGGQFPQTGANSRDPYGQLLQIRAFTPTEDWFGLSPLFGAAHSIDNLNAGLAWNTALLQNAGRPSLAFTHESSMDPEAREALKETLQAAYGGPENAGKTILLTGGLGIERLGMNPTEMDWLKGMQEAGLNICRVLNVAPELVGFSGSKTFDNYATAKESLYTENVFPVLESIAEHLTTWLLPLFDDGLVLGIDTNSVDAIWEARMNRLRFMSFAWWMTINQHLEQSGLPGIGPQGEVLMIPQNLVQVALTPQSEATMKQQVEQAVRAELNGHIREVV